TQHHLVRERFFDDTGGMQLVVHSPYGGRINRALGLALRKKFCRTFDFELQAAATDDAHLLSLRLTQPSCARSASRTASRSRRCLATSGAALSRRRSSTPSSTPRCSKPAGAGT